MALAIKERSWCLTMMGCQRVPDITIDENVGLWKEGDFGERIGERGYNIRKQ